MLLLLLLPQAQAEWAECTNSSQTEIKQPHSHKRECGVFVARGLRLVPFAHILESLFVQGYKLFREMHKSEAVKRVLFRGARILSDNN